MVIWGSLKSTDRLFSSISWLAFIWGFLIIKFRLHIFFFCQENHVSAMSCPAHWIGGQVVSVCPVTSDGTSGHWVKGACRCPPSEASVSCSEIKRHHADEIWRLSQHPLSHRTFPWWLLHPEVTLWRNNHYCGVWQTATFYFCLLF